MCAARHWCLRRQVEVKMHLALPAPLVRLWQSLLSRDTAVGRADPNLLGSTCKILWFSPGAVLSELGCSRCGKGGAGKQIQERPQRAAMTPQEEVSGEQRTTTDLTFWQQL